MIDQTVDPEHEILPTDPSSPSRSSAVDVPGRDPDSIRKHAEEFVVEWMAGAVQKSKQAIVAEAMKRSPSRDDLCPLDQAIIDVISRWNFSQDLEQAGSGRPIVEKP